MLLFCEKSLFPIDHWLKVGGTTVYIILRHISKAGEDSEWG